MFSVLSLTVHSKINTRETPHPPNVRHLTRLIDRKATSYTYAVTLGVNAGAQGTRLARWLKSAFLASSQVGHLLACCRTNMSSLFCRTKDTVFRCLTRYREDKTVLISEHPNVKDSNSCFGSKVALVGSRT